MLIKLPFVEEVYFGKAKDVVGELRSKWLVSGTRLESRYINPYSFSIGLAPLSETNRDRAAQLEMIKSMQK